MDLDTTVSLPLRDCSDRSEHKSKSQKWALGSQWWQLTWNSALGSLKQEDCEFKITLVSRERDSMRDHADVFWTRAI